MRRTLRRDSSVPARGPRWNEIVRPGRVRRPRRWGGKVRRAALSVGVLLLVIVVAGAALLTYARLKLKANAERIEALSGKKPEEPMNVLVLGSDSRAVLPESEQERFDPTGQDRQSGRRADTIILIHIDERREQAVLVHFPRDLRVRYPNGKTGKINGAYGQGPGTIVDTVEAFTDLPIHHYVEVNFVGFRNIVNALGGVEVYFEKPLKDPDSGLDVPSGCVELKGDQALAFARVRKIDDDFGRISRQQLFVRLMMDKVVSAGTILNPVKVIRLTNLAAENVTHDDRLTLSDAKALALRLRTFDPKRVDMRVVPSTPTTISGVSYVIANQSQTGALFGAIKERRRPLPDYGRTGVSPIDPADVRVMVLNGTGVKGLAARGAQELQEKGFEVLGTDNADRSDYAKTAVFFQEGSQQKARLVAGPYGAGVNLVPKTIATDAEVVVVFGKDYADGNATLPPPAAPSKGQAAPKPLIHPC